VAQMKMFLTRLGNHSKVIITGDPSQVDLSKGLESGFIHAIRLLKNIQGIAHIELDASDVLRHRLVKEIINAYESEKECS
jgi:phosphate starvation-inducible PhoH-like protein